VERLLAKDGSDLRLVGRNEQRLVVLKDDLLVRGAHEVRAFTADLENFSQHNEILAWAKACQLDFDTVLLAYGTLRNPEDGKLSVELTVQELYTNFVTAAALLTLFAQHFEEKGEGCGGGTRR
jgi:short-subunit dehydrogenase